MAKASKSVLILLIPLLFLLSGTMLGTAPQTGDRFINKAYTVPSSITIFFNYSFLFLLIILSALGLIFLLKNKTLSRFNLILSSAYLLLLLWSLVTFEDLPRYVLLYIGVLLSPIGLYYIINKTKVEVLSKLTTLLFILLLLISTFYSIMNFQAHPRISGMHSNPNLMGFWVVANLAVVIYFESHLKRSLILLLILWSIILVLATGSRLDFVLLAIILSPFVYTYKKSTILILVFAISTIYLNSINPELRALDLSDSVSDSGRSYIWKAALKCISDSPIVGNGMNSTVSCLGRDNAHNSYLRISLMIGLPLSLIFYTLYLYSIIKLVLTRNAITVKLYFLCIPIALIAEDYIIGVSSPFFAFFIFFIALSMLGNEYIDN